MSGQTQQWLTVPLPGLRYAMCRFGLSCQLQVDGKDSGCMLTWVSQNSSRIACSTARACQVRAVAAGIQRLLLTRSLPAERACSCFHLGFEYFCVGASPRFGCCCCCSGAPSSIGALKQQPISCPFSKRALWWCCCPVCAIRRWEDADGDFLDSPMSMTALCCR